MGTELSSKELREFAEIDKQQTEQTEVADLDIFLELNQLICVSTGAYHSKGLDTIDNEVMQFHTDIDEETTYNIAILLQALSWRYKNSEKDASLTFLHIMKLLGYLALSIERGIDHLPCKNFTQFSIVENSDTWDEDEIEEIKKSSFVTADRTLALTPIGLAQLFPIVAAIYWIKKFVPVAYDKEAVFILEHLELSIKTNKANQSIYNAKDLFWSEILINFMLHNQKIDFTDLMRLKIDCMFNSYKQISYKDKFDFLLGYHIFCEEKWLSIRAIVKFLNRFAGEFNFYAESIFYRIASKRRIKIKHSANKDPVTLAYEEFKAGKILKRQYHDDNCKGQFGDWNQTVVPLENRPQYNYWNSDPHQSRLDLREGPSIYQDLSHSTKVYETRESIYPIGNEDMLLAFWLY